jgi:hypothetical protein
MQDETKDAIDLDEECDYCYELATRECPECGNPLCRNCTCICEDDSEDDEFDEDEEELDEEELDEEDE